MKSQKWKNNPSYSAIHKWLTRNFSHLKKSCNNCKSKRFVQFALKKGSSHKKDIKHYNILCASCHIKYDYTEERREKARQRLTQHPIFSGVANRTSFKKGSIPWNKGKKMSDEVRKNMSLSKMGIKLPPFTKEHKRKIGEANKIALKKYYENLRNLSQ